MQTIIDSPDLMENLNWMYNFFEEVQIVSGLIPNREYRSREDVEDIMKWIEDTEEWILENGLCSCVSTTEGSLIIRYFREIKRNPEGLLENLRFYNILKKHLNCEELKEIFRKVYEEMWPEEEVITDRTLMKKVLGILGRVEEQRGAEKEATPEASLS